MPAAALAVCARSIALRIRSTSGPAVGIRGRPGLDVETTLVRMATEVLGQDRETLAANTWARRMAVFGTSR
jgi:hypothetical protein